MASELLKETDYRQISQQYAQGGINAVILANGGAAVAVLSQLADLKGLIEPTHIGWALICFVAGVTFGLITWVAAFASTRHVDRYLRGEDETYASADNWMHVGIGGILLAAMSFLTGCLVLAVSYMSITHQLAAV